MKRFLVFIIFIMAFSLTVNAQVSVIVNKSVSEASVDAAKLKDIYSLKTTKWGDGSKIVVFNLKAKGAVQDKFYNHLGVKISNLKKTWMKAQLTGEGTAPKSLGSETDVLQKVSSTPGAVGFVGSGKVTNAVKVVSAVK